MLCWRHNDMTENILSSKIFELLEIYFPASSSLYEYAGNLGKFEKLILDKLIGKNLRTCLKLYE